MGMYCHVSAASAEDLRSLSAETTPFDAVFDSDIATADGISLEKAWHGLHFLLTGQAWEGRGPLAFLLSGGEHVDGDEEGPRWLDSQETERVHEAISRVSDDDLWSRFDRATMQQHDIYPGIWDENEEDLKEEYLDYFHELKTVVAAAAQNGQGLLISIG